MKKRLVEDDSVPDWRVATPWEIRHSQRKRVQLVRACHKRSTPKAVTVVINLVENSESSGLNRVET
jgi:hypothetical protein